MAQIDIKNCLIRLKGGSTGNVLKVKIGEGNLTYDEKVNRIYYRDRGLLDEVRNGDEEPMDIKLDATWIHVEADSGAAMTVEDALKQRAGAAAWTSSDSDSCRPYAVDIEIEYNPICTEKTEVITLPDFRYESISHDLKGGTFSISGKCNAKQALVAYLVRSTESGT